MVWLRGFLRVSVVIAIPLTCKPACPVFVNGNSCIDMNGHSQMSPRTKRITNAQLLDTAARVVNERGAEHTRLSDIAAASGLAPATLLQRFGSLEGLLDAISAVFVQQVRDAFDVSGASPLARLEASLLRIAGERHLVFLL